MSAVITVLHVIACVFLIAVVLLQRGKGAQVGAVFGGGAGATVMKNQNGVVIELKSTTQGASLKLAASGINLTLEK